MLQEDSNGETFEIIDKKADELSIAESLSSMSSSASLLPSPGVSVANVPTSGNLLSNVQPPSALPSFIMQSPIASPPASQLPPVAKPMQGVNIPLAASTSVNMPSPTNESFYPTKFSAAIPPSKGIQHGMQSQETSTDQTGDSGGFMDWMRGAVGNGGILSRVAEKALSSVDSIVTTLDPQMREFIYTGGDVEILVASKQEVKISAVREAFQSVFGKARVEGIEAKIEEMAAQPVGFTSAVKAAESRVQTVLANPILNKPIPVVAIENFILEIGEDKWFDLGVIILNDPIRQVHLQTFTQMTPVPAEIVALAQEDTPTDYKYAASGLAVTIGSLMGSNLHVSNTAWHQALIGISRRDIILTAAKSLAHLYKNSIGNSTE